MEFYDKSKKKSPTFVGFHAKERSTSVPLKILLVELYIIIHIPYLDQFRDGGNAPPLPPYKTNPVKCRADLNFEVDFGVNGTIGAIVTKWDLILFR